MAQGETYEQFIEKFKPKKTTDDCYTPPKVYDAVLDYVKAHYDIDEPCRPFYPGGDYEKVDYTGKTVVDNPPFSIFSKILDFYEVNDVKYFLFAPALTVLSNLINRPSVSCIFVNQQMTYTNGANVRTAFVTNLESEPVIKTAPDLDAKLYYLKEKKAKKIALPAEVLTASRMMTLCRQGKGETIKRAATAPIRGLDCGYRPYGAGALISTEKATRLGFQPIELYDEVYQLSDRERKIVEEL